MKRFLLSLVTAIALLLTAWLIWPKRTEPEPAALARSEPAIHPEEKTPMPGKLAVEDAEAPIAPRESANADTGIAPASVDAAPKPIPKPQRKFDPKAGGWIYLTIQDPEGAAVVDADVQMTGLLCAQNPGSTHDWIGERSAGKTDADGSVRLRYPLWIDADRPTSHVSFRIDHPDFYSFEAQGFPVDPLPRVIVLQRGSFVIVSGWIQSPSEVVRDVKAHMTLGALVSDESWVPLKDGRPSCANVPPGRHGVYLSHTSPTLGPCFSEVAFFDIAAGEQKELHLRLVPGRGFNGRLDTVVPRPILGGEVMVNLSVGSNESSGATMPREFTAEVHADGTFQFASIPPGAGQIVGICEGWASARVLGELPRADPRLDVLPKEEREKKIAFMHDLASVPQSIDASQPGESFELKMERTASIDATIVDPKGHPIADATLRLAPDVHWNNGSTSKFPQRSYEGRSDAGGRVTIANLPRGIVFAEVQHERYVPSADVSGERRIQVELAAGETKDLRIVLEPRQDQ